MNIFDLYYSNWSTSSSSWPSLRLHLSGEPAAPGQHWVQRPRPAGPAAAWQGNECDNAIVSASRAVCCAPPLRCPFPHPAPGNPLARRWPDSGLSVWFPIGLCEGGHPDEGQQEEPPATTPVSGKRSRNFWNLNKLSTIISNIDFFNWYLISWYWHVTATAPNYCLPTYNILPVILIFSDFHFNAFIGQKYRIFSYKSLLMSPLPGDLTAHRTINII